MRNSESTILATPPPGKPVNLGEWCVRTGAATAGQVQECLDLQRACHDRGESAPRLGELLVARGYLSAEQVAEALASQGREIRSCPRCGIRVNVIQRPDAVGYECVRCHGRLQEPSDPGDLSATDDAVIVKSRDPLPPEVCEAARDPENVFGKYILLRELGRGGVGQIYLAWDTFLCQRVALKRLRPDMHDEEGGRDRDGSETLIREARHAIRLRHPAIVSVFDIGREGKDHYISMEYVEGRSLDDELRRARVEGFVAPYHRDPVGTLRMLAEVAHALHYAHTSPAPVVHCDLKPGNIMVDPQGRPHVLDFGLARRLGLPRSGEREISGTPNYMAPEQAAGWTWEIDARTDVYGLGAVLYELLTGRPPFSGDPLAILQLVADRVPVRPSVHLEGARVEADPERSKVRALPRRLDDLCMECLEKDKAKRPQTLQEVAQTLEQIARSLSPVRAAPTVIVPPARPRRRGRAVAVAVASILVAGAFVLGAALTQRPAPRGPSGAERAAAALGEFRPEAVPDLTSDPGLRAEAAHVASLRNRILGRMARAPLALEELRLRERTLRDVRVTEGDSGGLDARMPDLTLKLTWADLEPSQILVLARESGAEGDPDGLLALGIFSMRAGRRMDAKGYFETLKCGPHGPIAERYLATR